MRRIFCMLFLSLLYMEVYAQLGYWYKNDFIELIPVRDSVLFVQTNEDLSAVCKDAIANKELKVVLKASKNQYIVKSEKKYLPVKSYTSVFYKHNNESNEVVILPQIAVSVSDEAVKNTILKQYQGILSISNKVKNIYEMECDLSSSDEVLLLAMQIAQIKGVNWCEPNKMFGYNNSNPLYANQFYLKNTNNPGVDINVEPAWNIVNVNTNIKVAVIDCGVDKNHEDLYSNIIDGYTVNDSNSKGGCILSNTSHGTACAGIVGAINNSIGIRGVASGVKIMPINVTTGYLNYYGNDIYCSDNEIANAIIWAVDNGADVLSCSWGGESASSYIESAIDYARSEGRNGKGTIVVFAAGNNYPNTLNVSFPASYSGTIAVGAVDRYGTICSYSQRGSNLDLVALSNQIYSIGEIYTTCKTNTGNVNNNYTSSFGGTSAACPQVAGVAALMLSANPNLYVTQIEEILRSTATDYGVAGRDDTYGYGLVNAYEAVSGCYFYILGSSIIYNSSEYSISNLPSTLTINWSLSGANASCYTVHNNTPSINQCTVTLKDSVDFVNTNDLVLNAQIKYGSTVITTVTKPLTPVYIYGPTVPYSTEMYEVNNLPDDCTVSWNWSGTGLTIDNTPVLVEPYYSTNNYFKLVRNNLDYAKGTLTTTINRSGNTIATMFKNIDTGVNFSGTWYQGLNSPSTLTCGNTYAISGSQVVLQSDNFIGRTMTCSNNGMMLFGGVSHSGNTISFTPVLPTLKGDEPDAIPGFGNSITINVTDTTTHEAFKFTFYIEPQHPLNPPILSMAVSGNEYTFTIDEASESRQAWTLEVVKIDTGQQVYSGTTDNASQTVRTSNWQSGIYAALVRRNGQIVATQKMTIK